MDIQGIEIFREGTWKGKTYSAEDLKGMIQAFEEFKLSWFLPALKDGHHTEKGRPALGYITRLKQEGSKLIADITDMPKAVYDAIRERKYDRVSVEIVPKVERHGKVYKNVLWALALLGVEVPEVDGLRPLREAVNFEYGPELGIIETYDGGNNMMNPLEAGRKIDELVRAELDRFPEMNYTIALKRILDRDLALKEAYARGVYFPNHDPSWDSKKLPDQNPIRSLSLDIRNEVDERVREYMMSNPQVDYETAMDEIFALDPKLKEDYAKS